jgi:hypothetical protein
VTFGVFNLFLGGDRYGQPYIAGFGIPLTLSGATAISFDLGTFYPSSLTASVNSGAPITIDTAGLAGTFFSITDTSPITSIVFSQPTPLNPLYFDNELDIVGFQVGSVVPEPASLAIVGAGILGLIASRRRLSKV